MTQAKYFNKGTVRGTLTKCDIVEYEKDGNKGKFLSLEVTTEGNRIKGNIFNTKKNPNLVDELHDAFPINKKVEITGRVQEREYETQTGKKGIDRSLSVMTLKDMPENTKEGAKFILQGIVDKIKEVDSGVEIIITVDNSYKKEDGELVEREDTFTLHGNKDIVDLIDDLDVNKGCNAKFKGQILNKLIFDDYGDIEDSIQMFLVEKIENVVQKDDLEEQEEVSFL